MKSPSRRKTTRKRFSKKSVQRKRASQNGRFPYEQCETRILLSVNDPPVNTVPGPQSTQVDTSLAFTDFRDNRISTDDVDAGLNPVRVTLTAENGVITLINANPDGLTYEEGDGSRDVTMTFVGRLTSIDAALEWVVFFPDTDYVGPASLTITTDDQGYFGTGGPKSDTDVIAIDVTDVPPFEDPPTWTTFPSALDTTFDDDGMKTLSLSGGVDYIYQIKPTSDGKYLAVGAINNHFGVMRFNADLSLDTTFGNQGTVEFEQFEDGRHAYTWMEDHNGRYLIGGQFHMARLLTDGTLDTTFGDGGVIASQVVYDIDVQADGMFVTAGDDGLYGHVQRYTYDGTLNFEAKKGQIYGNNTGWERYRFRGITAWDHLTIQTQGRVHTYSSSSAHSNRYYFNKTSFFTDQYPEWNKELHPRFDIHSVLDTPDNGHLYVGSFENDVAVFKTLAGNGFDETFGEGGIRRFSIGGSWAGGLSATLESDGQILVSGNVNTESGSGVDLFVARMSYDGVMDEQFDSDGVLTIPFSNDDDIGYSVLQTDNKKILIVGRTGDDIALVRLYGDHNIFKDAPPTLDPLDDLSLDESAAEQIVPLTGVSAGGDEEQPLKVTATSSNTSLILHPTIEYTTPDETGTLRFTPNPNLSGTVTVTVYVEDGGPDQDLGTADDNTTISRSFLVTIEDVNSPPTLDSIDDLTLYQNSDEQTINLTGITAGDSEEQDLQVTTVSSNPALIPNPTVDYTSPNNTGQIRFQPIPYETGTTFITVTVEDGGDDNDLETPDDNLNYSRTFMVTVLKANLPPVNSVPGPQSTQVDTPLGFTAYRDNLISISDPDAALNPVVVTLTATHGTITLNYPDPNGGLDYSEGDGTDDVTMTFSGNIPNINAALKWVVFQPEAGYTGSAASFTITTDDQGYLGPGGPKQDTDTINIEVTAVPPYEPSPTWTTFPSALDPNFDGDGMKTLDLNDGDGVNDYDHIYDMQLLSSGKLLAVGQINWVIGLIRFNADLSLDTSFGTGGFVQTDETNAYSFTIDKQDRILVGGVDNPSQAGIVVRYLPDGQLDTSFGNEGVYISTTSSMTYISDIDIQPDGKIIIGGGSQEGNGWGDFTIERLTEDGIFDTYHNRDIGGGRGDAGRQMVVRDDGNILLIGTGLWGGTNEYDGGLTLALFDHNLGFLSETIIEDHPVTWVNDVIVLPDNKILVAGETTSWQELPYSYSDPEGDFLISRHHFDGTLDTTFGDQGKTTIPILDYGDRAYSATLQKDGKILLTGPSYNGDNTDISIVRLNQDGSLDNSFSLDGKHSINFSERNDTPRAIVAMPNGKIVIAGRTDFYNEANSLEKSSIALLQLYGDSNQDGMESNLPPVNSVPGPQSTQVDTPLGFTAYRDNLISISDPDAALNPVVVTLTATHGTITLNYPDPNGGLDYSEGDGTDDVTMTFSGNIPNINAALKWVVFQPEAGYTGSAASFTITTDDQGYLGPGGPKQDTDTINIEVTAVPPYEPSPTWTTFPSALDPNFDGDGMKTLDLNDGDGVNDYDHIYDMQLLSSGKLLAVGQINWVIGLIRFNADLSLDTSFGTGGFVQTDETNAYSFTIDKQDRILVGGVDNPSQAGIVVRYLPDGQLDTSFGNEGVYISTTSSMTYISDIDIQPDGKIIIGGGSQEGNGWGDFTIERLTEDGIFDTYHNRDIGGGRGDAGRQMVVRDDGNILLIGTGLWGGTNEYDGGLTLALFDHNLGFLSETIIEDHPVTWVNDVIVLPDNKILVAGETTSWQELPYSYSDPEGDFLISRHHFDGTLDTTFGDQGKTTIPILDYGDRAYSATLQKDGKILLTGPSYNGDNTDISIVRLNQDGSLDNSFSLDGKHSINFSERNDTPRAIVAMPNGKIVIAGRTDFYNEANSLEKSSIALLQLYGDWDIFGEANSNPTLDSINDLEIDENSGEHTVDLTGISAGMNENQNLRITVTSDNTALIPTPTVQYNSPDTTGSLTFSPSADQYGSAFITVTVEDAGPDNDFSTSSDNKTTTRFFQVTVNIVNDPPYFDPIDDITIDEDAAQQTIDVTGIDAGFQESQNLRVTASSDNSSLIPTLNVDYNSPDSTGTVHFTPLPNQFGTAIITITVEDGGDDNDLNTSGDNLTFSRTFQVTVDPVNDTPSVDPINDLTIDEDASEQTVNLTGIDAGGAESQNLRVTASSDNTSLTGTPTVDYNSPDTTGTVRFTPMPNQFGVAIITVTVEDGGEDNDLNTSGDNLTFSRTFTVTVNPVNDTPSVDPISDLTIDEDASEQTVDLTGIDAGGGESQNLRVTATSNNTNLIPTLNVDYSSPNSTGTVRFTPLPNQFGTAIITVTVEDAGNDNDLGTPGDNLTYSRTFQVTVNPVNDTPSVDPISDLTIDEDAGQQTVNLSGIDAGGGESQNLRVTGNSNNTSLTGTPTVDYNSPNSTGTVHLTPLPDQFGTAIITVTVEDGGDDNDLNTSGDNLTFSRTFTITVNPVNDTPSVDPISDLTIDEDASEQTVDLTGIDAGGGESQNLRVTATSNNTNLIPTPTVDYSSPNSTGTVRFTPLPNQFGTAIITVTVEDAGNDNDLGTPGDNLTYSRTFQVTVNPVNDTPSVDPISDLTIDEDAAEQSINLTGIDAGPGGESQNLRVTASSDNTGLIPQPSVSYNSPNSTGQLWFTPLADQYGSAIITVTVEDAGDDNDINTTSDNLSVSRTFQVIVDPINDRPVLDASGSPQLADVLEDTPAPSGATGTLVSDLIDSNGSLNNFSDVDGDPPAIAITGTNLQGGKLWYSIDSGSNWSEFGDVSANSATLLYADIDTRLFFEPAENYSGAIEDVITFKAWDRTGDFENGTIQANTTDGASVELAGEHWVQGYNNKGVKTSEDGKFLFTCNGDILSIESPSEPVRISNMGAFKDIAFSSDGQIAYSASGGISIVDISDISNPTQIGSINLLGTAFNIAISSDERYAYVATWQYFIIVDISDPTSPAEVSRWNPNNDYTVLDVSLSTDGRHAFVAVRDEGFVVLDVTNPSSPRKVAAANTGHEAWDVTNSHDGNHIFVADYAHGLQIFDVTDPVWPARIGGLILGGNCFEVEISGDGSQVFAAVEGSNSLHVIDITDLTSPELIAKSDEGFKGNSLSLSKDSSFIFVNEDSGSNNGSNLRIFEYQPYSSSHFSEVTDVVTTTVHPVNDAPLLDPIEDLTIDEDAAEQTINLTGIDAGGAESQNLRVTASSDNTSLTGTPTVDYNSPDTTGTVRFTPMPNQFGVAIITVTVEDGGEDNDLNTSGDNLTFSRTFTVTVNPVNDTPSVDPISDLTIDEDASEQTVDLTGIDAGGGESQNLRVTATSNNTNLIPTPTVDYSSPNSTGTVRFTPLPNQFGTAIITVTVEDAGNDNDLGTPGDNLTYSRTFQVTVNPVNDTPSVDPISDLTINEDAAEQSINLTGIDAGPGGESQNLRVTASSDNTSLIGTPTVDYSSPNSTGTVRLTPLPDQFGSAIITVTVEDGGDDNDLNTSGDNLTTSRSFTVTVDPVNDTPTVDPINDLTIDEDAAQQSIGFTGIDAGGGESQNLRVTASSDNTSLTGTPTVDYNTPDSTGTVRLTPLANQFGTAILTVTVEDAGLDGDLNTPGDNLTTSRSFTVTVDPVNDTPSVDPISDLTIDEDAAEQSINLTGIDAGPGGESQNLRVTASSDNTSLTGTPTVDYNSPNSTGTVRLTPLPDQSGSAIITVTVEDGGDDNDLNTSGDNLTFSRTFLVTVNPVNDTPLLDPISDLTIDEDSGQQTVNLSGIDAGGGESQNLRVTASSNNTSLVPTPTVDYSSPESTGTVRFTPLANQFGTAILTVTIEDGGDDNDLNTSGDNLTFSRTFTVTVAPVNDTPSIDPISDMTIDEDAAQQSIGLTGIDAGGGESQNLRVTASSNDTSLTGTPSVDYNSPNSTGTVRFTPLANQFGTAIITVTVEDAGNDNDLNTSGDNLTYSRTFTVTVNPVNDTPSIDPIEDMAVPENAVEQTIDLSGIDAGGGESQNLRVTASSNNTSLIPTPTVEYNTPDSTGYLRFTPSTNQNGTATITVTVEDGGDDNDLNTAGDNLAYSQTFTVTVDSVNQPPTLDPVSDLTIDEDAGQQTVNLSGIDAGGDESQDLRVTASSDNTGLIPTPTVDYNTPDSTGSVRFTPTINQFGTAILTVTVEDAGLDGDLNTPGDNLKFSQTFQVTVNPVNDTPSVDPISDLTINEDAAEQSINLTGIDAGPGGESQNLRVTASSDNTSLIGTPTVDYSSPNSTGTVRLTPLPDQSGSAIITVTVEDGGDDNDLNTSGDNLTTSRSFTVTVDPVNDTPTVDPINDLTIDEDAAQQSIGFTGIDAGGGESQNLRVTASSDNTSLTGTPTVDYNTPDSTGTVRLTPLANQFGTAILTVTVEDAGLDGDLNTPGDNLTTSRSFTVTVDPVNDTPSVDPISDLTIDEDAAEQSIGLTGIDAGGGESQDLRVTASSDNTSLTGTPTVDYNSPNSTGAVRFTPLANQSGSAIITVTVEDGGDDNDLNTSGDNLTFSRTFLVTVNPVNDTPLLDPISDLTIDEDSGQQTVNLSGIDAGGGESQNLRVTASSNNTSLTGTPSVDYNSPNPTGTVRFTPLANQFGTAILTVTIEDGGDDNDLNTSGDNLTFSRTFTVTVDPVNDTPSVDPINDLTIDEDAAQQTINLTGIDAGGGESQNLRVTASSNDTSLTGTPSVDYNSPNSTGAVRFTPLANQFGTAIITVTVEDAGNDNDLNTSGDNLTYSRTFTVTVNPVNDTPSIDPIEDMAVPENAVEQTIDLSGIDAGGGESQNLRVTASSNNTSLIPTPTVEYNTPDSTGYLRFTPSTNQNGTATITVTVEDGGDDNDLNTPGDNLAYSQTFTVTVDSVNQPPTLDPVSDLTIDEDAGQQTVNLSGIDAGGDESQDLRVTASSDNTNLIPTPTVDYNTPDSTGTVRLTPLANQFGTAILTVTVEDAGLDGDLNTPGDNLKFSQTFQVTVSPVNDTPLLDSIDDLTIEENASERTVILTGIDAGGGESQKLRVTASSNSTGLIPQPSVNYNSPNTAGSIQFTPLPDQYGSAIITVTIEDAGDDNNLDTSSDNLTFSRTFTVTVNEVNELGPVNSFRDQGVTVDGERWYQGSTSQAGLLTVLAQFDADSSNGDLEIELLDAQKQLIATATPVASGLRIDYTADVGETFYLKLIGDQTDIDLRILNLVQASGDTVTVAGTDSADDYTLAAGPTHRLVVHGIDYTFSGDDYDAFNIDGAAGADSIWIGGTSDAESVDLRMADTQITGAGYTVQALNIGDVVFTGRGGADTATFYDTNTADTFSSSPNWSKMVGASYSHIVRGLPSVTAHATVGYDLAFMGDSDGDDTYETFSERVVMTTSSHVATAIGFKRSSGTSTGGNDTATAHDSAGNDRLLSYEDRIILFDGTHTHTSIDFTTNQVFASGQAGDVAYMFDSAGDDQMVARPESTVITQSDRQTTAQGFAQSFAYASTGNDTAEFYDTAGNNDYNGYLDRAVMKGDGIFLWGRGFDQMTGHFSSGSDRALMFDSEGDDTYVSGASDTTMSNSSATNRIVGYSSIYAYSDSGSDTATLHDTAGQETFRAYPDKAVLHGDDMFSWTRGFSQVTAHSSGGTDEAQLYDSAGDDTFRSEGASVQMSGDGYLNLAQGFLKNSGYSSGGSDTALMFDTSGDDLYRTYPTEAVMIGSGVTNTAYGFGQTQGFSNTGTDSARLFDSADDDLLMSYADRATLSGDGWANEVVGFYLNTVYGSGGYDQATMEDSTGDDLVKVRTIGPRLTQGDGTVFDVRTFDRILARSVNGGEDIAELLDVDYEFELEGDWNS